MTIVVGQAAPMSFLDAVNRIFRIAGIIRGDTDAIQTFSDLQHGSSIQLAMIAVQDTLTDLLSFYSMPYQRASGTITLTQGTRIYSLPTDFVQFWQSNQFFYDSVGSNHIFEWIGGERKLAQLIWTYQTDQGTPNWWYYIEGTAKQIGFYQIPDTTYNNRVLTFDYEKDVIPLVETDNLPFIRTIEANSFCQMAAIRFQSIYNSNPKQPSAPVEQNAQYVNSRATLLNLVKPTKPNRFYGLIYPGR